MAERYIKTSIKNIIMVVSLLLLFPFYACAQSSVKILLPESLGFTSGEMEYKIGMVIDENLLSHQNGFSNFFSHGEIPSYSTDSFEVGWNNQQRIVFIRLKKASAYTKDNLKVGDSIEKMKSIMGNPHAIDGTVCRYFNDAYEHIEIQFRSVNMKSIDEITMFVWM